MSMPKPLHIVVISHDSAELSSVVTAILRDGHGHAPSYHPHIIPSSYLGLTERWELTKAGMRHNLRIPENTNSYVIDPRRIDLWLALDKKVVKYSKRLIKKMGPAPDGYYRNAFPNPVEYCGFLVPFVDKSYPSFEAWFDELKELFDPWKKRIWDAYLQSS